MATISEQKNKIRSSILEKLSLLSKEVVSSAASSICDRVGQLSTFQKAQSLALYFPYQTEVSVLGIDQLAREMGKRVAYPKVKEQSEDLMDFYWVDSLQELKKGSWNLCEPDPNSSLPATFDVIDLMIIPGLAFDVRGQRLGRGKAFYDKALKNYQGIRLGVAYDFQIFEQLPHEAWDEPVHGVVTETRYLEDLHA